MKRINQKCFFGSIGLHALLLVILLVAPAFLKRPEVKPEQTPVKLIDGAVLAMLSKAASAPAAVTPQPTPTPNPAPIIKKETPKPTPPKKQTTPKPPKKIEPKKPAPKKAVPKKPITKPKPKPIRKAPPKKQQPVIKTPTRSKPKTKPKTTVRKPTPRPKPKIKVPSLTNLTPQRDLRAEQERRRKAADEAQRVQQREDARRRDKLKSDLAKVFSNNKYSDPVTFKTSGGSSRSTMDYGSMLVKEYTRMWNPPAELAGRLHIVTVSVTIAKSGRVTSKRIIKKSGISSVDRSVQATLDRATRFRAFPAGMNESQKTYTIDFNLQAK
jgi:periplasmic protein TonB